MKKVHLLVINAFIRPFAVTFFIVMFVLLMLFLFKYIDDLIGKGFEWYVIIQLLWYASATNVAMALPLAILLSSIMTFGNLGENYELVAIKAAGISLQKAMYPLFIFISAIGITAFLFADYMLPIANLKMGSLLYDVRNKKASFLIDEGIFNTSIPGYAIRVDKKSADGQHLQGVTIYNQAIGSSNSIILAKEGEMYKTPDNNYLILKLKDGVRYEETSGENYYNPRQRLIRTYFNSTEQNFDLSSFQFKRENENLFRSNYLMLNSKQLKKAIDSIHQQNDSINGKNFDYNYPYYPYFSTPNLSKGAASNLQKSSVNVLQSLPAEKRLTAIIHAQEQIKVIAANVSNNAKNYVERDKEQKNYVVEYYRKFTLPVSCLVLFLIGAPMGAIIRKGGLGLPLVVCIVFFLAFHIVATIAEKWAKEGNLNPMLGMWTAILVFTPIGLFLTYKAARDSVLFDIEVYKKMFKRQSATRKQ